MTNEAGRRNKQQERHGYEHLPAWADMLRRRHWVITYLVTHKQLLQELSHSQRSSRGSGLAWYIKQKRNCEFVTLYISVCTWTLRRTENLTESLQRQSTIASYSSAPEVIINQQSWNFTIKQRPSSSFSIPEYLGKGSFGARASGALIVPQIPHQNSSMLNWRIWLEKAAAEEHIPSVLNGIFYTEIELSKPVSHLLPGHMQAHPQKGRHW